LHIVFVHTPMSTVAISQRKAFWRNFDLRYHATHPGLRHMDNVLWELPHWMLWLGGVLEHAGFESMETLDFYSSECPIGGIDEPKVRASLTRHPGDIFLFSPMTPNLPFALQIADLIKEMYPNATTIFGGVVATPLKHKVAAHPSVDYVVWERGEYALPALLEALELRTDLSRIGNLAFKTQDGAVFTSNYEYPAMPLEELPFPKVDLFPPSAGRDIRYIRQVYALGCPYKCSFCTIQTIGRKPSYFPIERVIAEIRAYRRHYGEHHNIYFGDETFTVNAERTLAICDALAAEGNIGYDCQTRLNVVNDDRVLQALKRSGCRWLEIGLETADQESQNLFKQRVKIGSTRDALARLRDAGIPVCSFMVNGFPNQSLDDMRYSVDWVCSLISDGLLQASYLFGLVPYPGSALYDAAEKNGLKLRHHDYRYYHEDMLPVFDTQFATAEQSYEIFLEGVAALGQAMSSRPYFGGEIMDRVGEGFGSFWESSHV
jgi:anaerobic magnesium-protoporphyrin IX monomethyl ester cyclase